MFQTSRTGELEFLSSPDADIYVQGAHLTRFRDWLFLSDAANFAPNRAIRGGVPVVFPWFGPHKTDADLPSHGWARTALWQVENVAEDAATLLAQNDGWRVRMKFGFADELRMRLEVENQSDNTRGFECALHTYFAVENVENVTIAGMTGKTYLDKTEGYARKTQSGDLKMSGETDRVYLDSSGPILVDDGARTISIRGQSGWRSTVVWNPWQKTAANMSDLRDWRKFVCVECGAVADDAVMLGAGENYALDIAIGIEQ